MMATPVRPRPPVPTLAVPATERRPFGRGVVGSALAHVVVLVFFLWHAATNLDGVADVMGGAGPMGGGGGGGSREHYMVLLAPTTSEVTATQQEATREPVPLPIPTPNLQHIPEPDQTPAPPLQVARVEVAEGLGPGSGGGPGAGTGSGGGIGSGDGPGIGSGTGPGTGGGGGTAFPPELRHVILPPADAPKSVKGHELVVHFWVDERGRVEKVEVEPPIDDAGYRRKFLERMYQYVFAPARTPEGLPVAAHVPVRVTP